MRRHNERIYRAARSIVKDEDEAEDVNNHTHTGAWGNVTYWNVRHTPDLLTGKLVALEFYQLALPAPKPPKGSFDAVGRRPFAVFSRG